MCSILQFVQPRLNISVGLTYEYFQPVIHRHMSPEHELVCAVYERSPIAQVCEEVQFVWLLAPLWEAATKRSEFKNIIPNP